MNNKKAGSGVEQFLDWVRRRNKGQPEFLQAVAEVAHTVMPLLNERADYREARLLERMTEPDRIISFRVCWTDDAGRVQINRGYRVQFNNATGPYKGGLRFVGGLKLDTLKFLGFEQVLKNSLTNLPIGGAKGGADFSTKGRSDGEILRFCQSFMTELQRHIGALVDVPAGDIGVGEREIGYLYGQYRRVRNEFAGALSGKNVSYGGIPLRPEATGHGCVYFAKEMASARNQSLEDQVCVISGSGNVAQYTCEKLIELGAKVVTLSDSDGFIYDKVGLTADKLAFVKELKNKKRGRIKAYAEEYGCEFYENQKPWAIPCDNAFPCATQNELDDSDAQALIDNGCAMVVEGANMPVTDEARQRFEQAGVVHAPGKAANAGGVAVSSMEMSQNAEHARWTRDEVDQNLQEVMAHIHQTCREHGEDGDGINYIKGANIAGFIRVADAMLAQGVV